MANYQEFKEIEMALKNESEESHIEGQIESVGGYNQEIPSAKEKCPICFGKFKLPCRTSCGHWFCGNCILTHWQSTTYENACECPLCKRMVHKFTLMQSLLSEQPQGDFSKVFEDINLYNRLNGSWFGIFLKVWRRLLSASPVSRLSTCCITCLFLHTFFEDIPQSLSYEHQGFCLKVFLYTVDSLFVVDLVLTLWRFFTRGQVEGLEDDLEHRE